MEADDDPISSGCIWKKTRAKMCMKDCRIPINYSYIDLNRAGTPLGEIVTAPDFRTSWQAYDYVNHVRRVLQWVGASDADMEKGNLRCEANVSVRKVGRDKIQQQSRAKEPQFGSVYAKSDRIRDRTTNHRARIGRRRRQETRLWDEKNN